MRFIQQIGMSVKPGQMGQLQAYVSENHDRIVKACPDQVQYLGTYAAVFTSEKEAGSVFTLWALEDYAGLDALADAARSGDLAPIADELASFIVDDGLHPWSKVLLRDLRTAAIMEERDR